MVDPPTYTTPRDSIRAVEDVELATLRWVHWDNTSRLHGYLADVPPAEVGNQ